MAQADGSDTKNMKIQKIVTKDLIFTKTPGFATIADAVESGKKTNAQRHKELGLDVTPIQNRKVVQFHWNLEQLVLQFDNNLFLRICLFRDNDEKINVSVEKNICIQTDWFLEFDLLISGTLPFLWKPSEIAKKYTGKIFEKIYLGESYLYLYFREMQLLIFCHVEQDITNDRLILTWSESEQLSLCDYKLRKRHDGAEPQHGGDGVERRACREMGVERGQGRWSRREDRVFGRQGR